MEKRQYIVTSSEGRRSVIHYIFDPRTGKAQDFKFIRNSNK